MVPSSQESSGGEQPDRLRYENEHARGNRTREHQPPGEGRHPELDTIPSRDPLAQARPEIRGRVAARSTNLPEPTHEITMRRDAIIMSRLRARDRAAGRAGDVGRRRAA